MNNGLGWYSRLEMLGILYSRIVYRKQWKKMLENEQRQIHEWNEAHK